MKRARVFRRGGRVGRHVAPARALVRPRRFVENGRHGERVKPLRRRRHGNAFYDVVRLRRRRSNEVVDVRARVARSEWLVRVKLLIRRRCRPRGVRRRRRVVGVAIGGVALGGVALVERERSFERGLHRAELEAHGRFRDLRDGRQRFRQDGQVVVRALVRPRASALARLDAVHRRPGLDGAPLLEVVALRGWRVDRFARASRPSLPRLVRAPRPGLQRLRRRLEARGSRVELAEAPLARVARARHAMGRRGVFVQHHRGFRGAGRRREARDAGELRGGALPRARALAHQGVVHRDDRAARRRRVRTRRPPSRARVWVSRARTSR